jgi:peroxiredoxin
LRDLPDAQRRIVTKNLALRIQRLPAAPVKVTLAASLTSLSTEGDFGRETLQEVTTTLGQALKERPLAAATDGPAAPYVSLAQLVRYEGMQSDLDDPQLTAAFTKLDQADQIRRRADFTLVDLQDVRWRLKALHGKVVLVNFWATWCPPCRKELPDLEALYRQFKDRGFVVLAISDEEIGKVKAFITDQRVTYPVLLDPGRTVTELFRVAGIPQSFVYDRDGNLVAQSIDMRTRAQFLDMLSRAGLRSDG